jgi:hypothetical protein
MKESARPDPLAAAQRVKDLARDARHLAVDLAEGYRRSSRYFKMRAAVIGSWALLSLLTLWAACPSSGPRNSLGAEAQISEEVLGTQVLVWNSSGELWTDVTLVLDDTWRWQTATVRDGQRLVIATSKFTRDGAPAPSDLKPKTLTIQCRQGKVTEALSAR